MFNQAQIDPREALRARAPESLPFASFEFVNDLRARLRQPELTREQYESLKQAHDENGKKHLTNLS
jgi:hypothetical protein